MSTCNHCTDESRCERMGICQAFRLLPRVEPLPAKAACVWSLNADDDSCTWESACGNAFAFNDGGPKENNARFCCYCGKPLDERIYNDENDAAGGKDTP